VTNNSPLLCQRLILICDSVRWQSMCVEISNEAQSSDRSSKLSCRFVHVGRRRVCLIASSDTARQIEWSVYVPIAFIIEGESFENVEMLGLFKQ
jgi:hypothetical protein